MSTSFNAPSAKTYNIQPGAQVDIDGPGTFARIQSASGAVNIGFDLGRTFKTAVGRGYKAATGESFSRVTLENPDAVNVLSVTILIGDLEEIDDTLHIVDSTGGLALDGTDGTGVVPPAGAIGIRGWLSAIYESLASTKNSPWTPAQAQVLVAAAGTPQALAAVDTFVDQLDIQALSTNTQPVKIGFQAGAGNQLWLLQPTEWKGYKAPNGKRINLKNVYVDAGVNGEGIITETHA